MCLINIDCEKADDKRVGGIMKVRLDWTNLGIFSIYHVSTPSLYLTYTTYLDDDVYVSIGHHVCMHLS